jgi:hypothetical protein
MVYSKKRIPGYLFCILVVLLIMIAVGCAPKVNISVQMPAEINTEGIKKVAIGKFEIAYIEESVQLERNGVWVTRQIKLTKEQKVAISDQIRAKIINVLGATPYFSLVYTDEFAKLENDAALQEMVSAEGYKSDAVDAVINGKIWLEMQKTDGSDISKVEMNFVQGGRADSLNVTVEKVVWWPYKSMRGNMTLEMKMTRLIPTEVVAVNLDSRTFSHRTGGKPEGYLGSILSATQSLRDGIGAKNGKIETSDAVYPSFEQLISDLATSIATNFIRRIAVTEKVVGYQIAEGGDERAKMLIQAGAYEMGIERLQKVTSREKNPNDLYNLGLSYEAIGEYGLARVLYNDAWERNKENLIFAQGIGRIERILREYPQIKRQLSEKSN